MVETHRAKFLFVVKESSDGAPFIVLESLKGTLPILEYGFIGLDLFEKTTIEQAGEIVDFLNNNVASVFYTGD